MTPTNKQALFIVSGASCAGKSTLCTELFLHEKDYIVMESDILWNEAYNTPQDGYKAYRRAWMRVCASISQIGKPVVLCGCAVPEQFEQQPERELFTQIDYLAVVCGDAVLEDRMRAGRGITDENMIRDHLAFNNWLKTNAAQTKPPITLLDNSAITPSEAAEITDRWIMECLRTGKAEPLPILPKTEKTEETAHE